MLSPEEHIEQAYLFRILRERLKLNMPIQELLDDVKEELLSSTDLPTAVGFLADGLRFSGRMSPSMGRLSHYFTAFQAFVMACAEEDRAKVDFAMALLLLEREAEYRAAGTSPQGLFLFQFEAISRNRLGYEDGLDSMALDPVYDADWSQWLRVVRRDVGLVDLAEMIFLRSEHYHNLREQQGLDPSKAAEAVLFGEKEGRIAKAHRRRDPLFLFASFQRHLKYPAVPRPEPPETDPAVLARMSRKVEQLEIRVRLLEEEAKGGVDLSKLYVRPPSEDESRKPSEE
ncbi:MAG: hypothetical protein N2C14_22020 [Planctomycetales bacterium]